VLAIGLGRQDLREGLAVERSSYATLLVGGSLGFCGSKNEADRASLHLNEHCVVWASFPVMGTVLGPRS
jgi:hypothetical protein